MAVWVASNPIYGSVALAVTLAIRRHQPMYWLFFCLLASVFANGPQKILILNQPVYRLFFCLLANTFANEPPKFFFVLASTFATTARPLANTTATNNFFPKFMKQPVYWLLPSILANVLANEPPKQFFLHQPVHSLQLPVHQRIQQLLTIKVQNLKIASILANAKPISQCTR